ncbi:Transposon Tf2-6 polyprotein [Hypsizygus marmoreus]|uniref:Transposon Tf2-6 polyprotein n=1 Tax=Hypsizygus marmoreus TaxID=39966 RepID=A0A369J4W5_HYPMA|nr:Transposon Tf2-6 polyprotein [Hypsizygus marmoreus]
MFDIPSLEIPHGVDAIIAIDIVNNIFLLAQAESIVDSEPSDITFRHPIVEEEFVDLPDLVPDVDSDESEAAENDSQTDSEFGDDEQSSDDFSTIDTQVLDSPFLFVLDKQYISLYPEEDGIDWNEDVLIFPTELSDSTPKIDNVPLKAYTAYKRVAQKVHPVSGTFPEAARVHRQFPHDPLDSLPPLSCKPPDFVPTDRLTHERMESLQVNPDNFLWPEEVKLFQHILKLNEATLPFEEKDRGTLSRQYFSDYIMPTVPHTPWEYKHIPIPPGIREKVIELLKSKIEAGVYETSQSSYRGQWFCVLKKNGTLRIVHNLQPLNKVSIRDAGQLPIIDDFVESYGGRQCYTVFDLFWGFDARMVDSKSRDMTAFYTPLGLLRLTALPMGYTNSPAEFQKCMTFILADEIPDKANIFIDDLPIKGPSTQYLDDKGNPETLTENPKIRRFIWEHAQDVHRIMHRIKCAGGTFSPKKTQICRQSVLIVGQKCTPEGRLPDDDQVVKIQKWPIMKTVKEVRGFLGLCGTVRIWIKDYSKLARPLTELIRKDADFEWNERCQESFDTLKALVSSAPALRPIDYTSDNPVIMSVDTSYIAVGFILSQIDEQGRRRPARYGSIPLNERESRYSQPKLELFGLYRALRSWRIYLIGVKNLVIEMDANCIKGIINNPDIQPNHAMNRWIQGILLFDFTLKHVPATQFKGPDALSRRPLGEDEKIPSDDDAWLDDIALLITLVHPEEFPSFDFSIPTHLPYQTYVLPSSQPNLSRAEQRLVDIKNFLETLEIPETNSLQARKRFLKSTAQYFLKEHEGQQKMYKKNSNQIPTLVVMNKRKRIAILTKSHDELGHKGEQAVFELIRLRFYWPHMRTDVHHHVSSCHECQIRNTKRMEVPLTISRPTSVFQKVYIDVMYMPLSGGKHLIVAAKDDLTGITEVRAIPNVLATTLASFFEEQIYHRYGVVGQVTTDNGNEVKGAFQLLLQRLGIPQVRISAYNKHANGVVERGHYIFREALIKSCEKNSAGEAMHWETKVSLAMFADRVTVNGVTGYSPFYLLHGMHPVLPFDLFEATFLVEDFKSGLSTSDLLALRIRQLEKHEDDIERASEVLVLARLQSKEQFNKRFAHRLQKPSYPEGALVLLRNTRFETELNKFKINPLYLGPFEVVRQTRNGAYVLKELDGTEHAEHYAAFRLLSYISRSELGLYMTEEEDLNLPSEENLEESL